MIRFWYRRLAMARHVGGCGGAVGSGQVCSMAVDAASKLLRAAEEPVSLDSLYAEGLMASADIANTVVRS